MPKGPRKFYFAFEKSGLTRAFGGLSLFQAFCRGFAIRAFWLPLSGKPTCDEPDNDPPEYVHEFLL
jgi:hypothetical protein